MNSRSPGGRVSNTRGVRGKAADIQIARRGRLGRYARLMEGFCIETLLQACQALELGPAHEISVLLCDTATIRRLNRRWRSIDAPTDVLSFPSREIKAGRPPPPGPLGDIVIALPVARARARRLQIARDRHLAHLLIHGLLHLLGYDHVRNSQARRMEAMEQRLLTRIEPR